MLSYLRLKVQKKVFGTPTQRITTRSFEHFSNLAVFSHTDLNREGEYPEF